jgi:hypothetical protein
MDKLDAEVKAKGMTVFARIDHAAGAGLLVIEGLDERRFVLRFGACRPWLPSLIAV